MMFRNPKCHQDIRNNTSLPHLYCRGEDCQLLYFELDVDLIRPVRRADDICALDTPCAEPTFALLQSCIDNDDNYHNNGSTNTCLGGLVESGVRRSRHSLCSAVSYGSFYLRAYVTAMLCRSCRAVPLRSCSLPWSCVSQTWHEFLLVDHRAGSREAAGMRERSHR